MGPLSIHTERTVKTKCDDCGSDELVAADATSPGGHPPFFLPGTGWTLFDSAKCEVQVCLGCGRMYWWVRGKDLDKVRNSKYFTRRKE